MIYSFITYGSHTIWCRTFLARDRVVSYNSIINIIILHITRVPSCHIVSRKTFQAWNWIWYHLFSRKSLASQTDGRNVKAGPDRLRPSTAHNPTPLLPMPYKMMIAKCEAFQSGAVRNEKLSILLFVHFQITQELCVLFFFCEGALL